MNGDHAFAFRVERHFIFAWIGFFYIYMDCACFGGGDDQRTFGGIAYDAIGLICFAFACDFNL